MNVGHLPKSIKDTPTITDDKHPSAGSYAIAISLRSYWRRKATGKAAYAALASRQLHSYEHSGC